MDITIIGTGNMDRAIATRALAGGHSVTLLGTEAGKAEALAGELSGNVRPGAVGDPLDGDVAVLAVWYQALDDVLGRYGDQLAGRVVVDITNPVDPRTFRPLTVEAGSAAQEASGAKVVKAFNTTFAGTLVAGDVSGEPLDVFVASDDDDAKNTVRQLAEDGGMRVVDAGPLAHAHQLEALGISTWRSRTGSAPATAARSRSSASSLHRVGLDAVSRAGTGGPWSLGRRGRTRAKLIRRSGSSIAPGRASSRRTPLPGS